MNESPFLIKPYIKDMTNSELFAVMVAGFGTIAGSVLGSYLSFGVSKKNTPILNCIKLIPNLY